MHFVAAEEPRSRYVCDECGSAWDGRFCDLTPEGRAFAIQAAHGADAMRVRDVELWPGAKGEREDG